MKGKKDKTAFGEKDIKAALVKKALGYDATEVVEEYVTVDEEIKLAKKKVTVKNIPPDMTALKILMDSELRPVSEMTDVELEEEKQRLMNILAENIKKENKE